MPNTDMLQNLQYLNDNSCLESFRFCEVSDLTSINWRKSTSKVEIFLKLKNSKTSEVFLVLSICDKRYSTCNNTSISDVYSHMKFYVILFSKDTHLFE